jgi:cellobiose-specific phosphotransferase system component IIB
MDSCGNTRNIDKGTYVADSNQMLNILRVKPTTKIDEKIYNIKQKSNSSSKKYNLENDINTRSSQLPDYNFRNLKQPMQLKKDNSLFTFFISPNHRKNQLVDKDREIEEAIPKNNVSRPHKLIDSKTVAPTIGMINTDTKFKYNENILECNRSNYLPRQFGKVNTNKVLAKVLH